MATIEAGFARPRRDQTRPSAHGPQTAREAPETRFRAADPRPPEGRRWPRIEAPLGRLKGGRGGDPKPVPVVRSPSASNGGTTAPHVDHRARLARRVTRAARAASTVADFLLEQGGPGVGRRLTARERRVESSMAALFVLVAGLSLVARAGGEPSRTSALLLVATYAFVARVRFQVGPGLVRPTELVLVPMLFLLPAPAVPALVAVACVLSELPEIAARRAHPERALVAVTDAWHTVGPAIVVALLIGEDPGSIGWSICLIALLSQFAVDFAASTVRERLGAGIRARQLAPVLAMIYVVDALLAPIGF